MFKNILGNYTISISKEQAKEILDLLNTKDVYQMTVGEYTDHAILINKVQEIVEDSNV